MGKRLNITKKEKVVTKNSQAYTIKPNQIKSACYVHQNVNSNALPYVFKEQVIINSSSK